MANRVRDSVVIGNLETDHHADRDLRPRNSRVKDTRSRPRNGLASNILQYGNGTKLRL